MDQTLNLGCGEDARDGAHNVDSAPLDGVDEVVDLDDTPWPWEDGAFEGAVARHVLEHLRDPEEALSEAMRVTGPCSRIEVAYPIGHTRFEDATHRHHWNYNTAACMAGERSHPHEHVSGLALVSAEASFGVQGVAMKAYAHARHRIGGPGPWMSQIPGLAGEVEAVYEVLP